MPLSLYYFPAPGRAEASRIMLSTSGTTFNDVRFTREDWVSKYKAKSPTGQSPFLELDDGSLIAQSSAIDRYVARLTGYACHDDAYLAAKTDELLMCLEEVSTSLGPSFAIADLDEKIAARKELMKEGGAVYTKLAIVDKLLEAKKGEFFAGDSPTLADISVFCSGSMLRSGMLDGINDESIASFKNMVALRKKVAEFPKIQAYYAEAEGVRIGFQP